MRGDRAELLGRLALLLFVLQQLRVHGSAGVLLVLFDKEVLGRALVLLHAGQLPELQRRGRLHLGLRGMHGERTDLRGLR